MLDPATFRLLVRYVAVGAMNTSLSFGVYCLVLFWGASFAVAGLVSLIIGIGISFVTNGRLVFRQRLGGRFGAFVVMWGALYLLNLLLIYGFVGIGLNAYLAGAAATPPTIITAFVIQKLFVFADLDKSADPSP